MTDKEYLLYLADCLEQKHQREAEAKQAKEVPPERDIIGTFWTHPYKDNS